jgi:two-component system, OmpR family, response regulator
MRILIVEDEPLLADGLSRSLKQAGYAVDCLDDGQLADTMLIAEQYDCMILDLGLPRLDGLEVLARLRRRGGRTPVLILTARDQLSDRVDGLDLGADDYMTKPFDLPELEARVRALIRRAQGAASAELVLGPLSLDTVGKRVTVAGAPVELSAREYSVLEVLMLRVGKVVGKTQLSERLYAFGEEAGPNAIEVYIHRLRKKVEPAVSIRTIRGLGYLLEQPGAAPAREP